MKRTENNFARENRFAKSLFGNLPKSALGALRQLIQQHKISVVHGDIRYLNGGWYVTHSGLLTIANRQNCSGIRVQPVAEFCDKSVDRWTFKATVFKSLSCRGFIGYGDADPSNVSPLVRGAEMRVAETRAVNRALRKAYGIGICSVEEIGSSVESSLEKLPPQNANGNGNGSRTTPKVRDRLCQIIRQHKLDAELVKAYAIDYCGTQTLKDATREQVENFVRELAEWAETDRDALLCQLNSYARPKQDGAA